ncbi:hypothetical protein PDJAM_G00121420 [Pangasius djambal]|uniref:Uncharacterized protein n=1 Tax=Pangasius djambal TaxID=1691987 RepID=A0ACC5ZA22_9TELE|nr:hypothetical protein [Pangasius djambal]
MLCILRCFSAHHGCTEWLFELAKPSCQLEPAFSSLHVQPHTKSLEGQDENQCQMIAVGVSYCLLHHPE